MTTALQLRRGTTDQHATYVGANGEVTVDTDKKTLVVNDGVTLGGTPLAREDSLTKFVRHDTAAQGLTGTQQSNVKTNIGLGNVSNTSDAAKPISTATQEALDGKLDKTGGTLTGPLTLLTPLTLPGYASSAMQAAPKEQVETIINTAVTRLTSTYIGGRGQVFMSSGTFTVPAGVTSVKVRGCGGGGGSGKNPSGGGTTSFGTYCSATGGSGLNTPGTASGGDINLTGGSGGWATNSAGYGGAVGGGPGGSYSSAGTSSAPVGLLGGAGLSPPTGYGNGAGGRYTNYSGSASGGYFEKYITGLTPGSSIWVTIGQGGTVGADGYAGAPGICIVEW